MENADKYFKFVCECDTTYCAADSKNCPNCSKTINQNKDLIFDIDGFLNKIYELYFLNKTADALDIAYDAFFNLYNKFEIINQILAQADIGKLNTTLLCGFLTGSFKYDKQIPNHILFFNRAVNKLKNAGESDVRIARLFNGLKGANNYWDEMGALAAPEWLTGPKPE